jgi:hypothetical protein
MSEREGRVNEWLLNTFCFMFFVCFVFILFSEIPPIDYIIMESRTDSSLQRMLLLCTLF